MQRNAFNRTATVPPQADIQRSRFDLSHNVLSTFSSGVLIPLAVEEVLPGSTFDINMAAVVRMATPLYPVMDSCFLDTYAFFVPNRLVWNHWKEFCGENNESAWYQPIEYLIPGMPIPNGGFAQNTNADFFGIPTKAQNLGHVSSLPFRGLRLIWNEWFRDQNLMDPKLINFGDTEIDASLNTLYPVCRYPDYFTTALPSPQKGPSVLLPLGERADVYWDNSKSVDAYTSSDSRGSVIWYDPMGGLSNFGSRKSLYVEGAFGNPNFGTVSSSMETLANSSDMPNGGSIVNGYADLSTATGATINSLRQAFAVQRFLERSARGGSRYREFLKSQFNVTSPDATQQVPEYLGGGRVRINVNQVIQQSASQDPSVNDVLGNTGAFSKTTDRFHLCTKSFTEHGYFFVLACVRCASGQTTQQGLRKMWSREGLYDFYLPVFATLGEQPVFNKEIYAYSTEDENNEVFGYQEAWAEYRYHPGIVSGAFRSNAEGTLDAWHYADKYDYTPRLSEDWIVEPKERIDRTLAVTSAVADQFLCNVWFDFKATLPMPTYSVPGLIDHH